MGMSRGCFWSAKTMSPITPSPRCRISSKRYVGERLLLIVTTARCSPGSTPASWPPMGTPGGRAIAAARAAVCPDCRRHTLSGDVPHQQAARPQALRVRLTVKGEPIPGQTLTVSSARGEVPSSTSDQRLAWHTVDQRASCPCRPTSSSSVSTAACPPSLMTKSATRPSTPRCWDRSPRPPPGCTLQTHWVAQLQRRGIERSQSVTLHVGPGIFPLYAARRRSRARRHARGSASTSRPRLLKLPPAPARSSVSEPPP